jgi:hypothetical protein
MSTIRRVSPPAPDRCASIEALRLLAKAATEGSADPQEAPHPDHDLMVLSDAFVALRKQEEAALEHFQCSVLGTHHASYADYKARRLATKKASANLAKLRPTTPAGLFAKAVAASRSSEYATRLGTSLAADLLEVPTLRSLLWPASTSNPQGED